MVTTFSAGTSRLWPTAASLTAEVAPAFAGEGLVVGTGVSGGEEGALHGPSIMPGGSRESYAVLGPMLEKISAHVFELLGLKLGGHHDAPLVPSMPTAKKSKAAAPG